jgi:outer membrane protein OmpA-like peptidoglycan-associated protein
MVMRKFLLLLLGLILLALLLFFCFNSKAIGIKNELVSGAQTAYKNENMNWVNVEIKGNKLGLTRVLALNGTAPNEELKAKAGVMAANISGVEGVVNNLLISSVPAQKSQVVQKPELKRPEIEVVKVKIPQKVVEPEVIEVVEVKIPLKAPEPEKIAQNCHKKFVSIMSKHSVNFEYNSASIKKESYSLLDNIVKIAKECPKAQLNVEGHTDWDGSKRYNKMLSSKRANVVKMYLIKKGVASDRIESIGYGESKPIADNKTVEGKNKNRRIEFKIKGVK